jgi:biopolymer transport protein ExbD
MKRRWRKKHLSQPGEVNITAFMNLMVILVPFLLITAVFSRMTVLELNVPNSADGNQAALQNPQEQLQLEVILRRDVVEIGDRKRGRLKLVEVSANGDHLEEVSRMLQQIKARVPDKTDITLLVEMDIPYQRLVEMMDTLRVVQVEREGQAVNAELFPAISIGDAPVTRLRTADRSEP